MPRRHQLKQPEPSTPPLSEALDKRQDDGQSVDDFSELGPEWAAEIRRRVAEMDAGRTRFVPADEAMAELQDHIQRRLLERQRRR